MSEWYGAGMVALAFLALFGVAEAWARIGKPPAEWTRKLVHMGGGLIACSFPWLFQSYWFVVLLSAGFAAVLGLSRWLGVMRSVHGVSRATSGAILFPIAVALLFWLTADQPAFYLASLLTLVVSDALAALLGNVYGLRKFPVEQDHKSLEGSVVFFLLTFLVVHLPLVLMTPLSPALTVLVALQIAILVTSVEAISINGLDNLVVPLGTLYLLIQMTQTDVPWMAFQLSIQGLVILAIAWLTLRYNIFSLAGAIGAQLYFYGAVSLGGPRWCIAPALSLAVLVWHQRRSGTDGPRYQIKTVFYAGLATFPLYMAGDALRWVLDQGAKGTPLHPVYAGAVAGILCCWLMESKHHRGWGFLPAALLASFLWIAPLSLWAVERQLAWTSLSIAFATASVTALAYRMTPSPARKPGGFLAQSRHHCIASLAGVSIGLLLYFGLT